MELTNKYQRRCLTLILLAANVFSLGIGQALSVSAQEKANNEYQEGAILWTQTSGERNALAYQAFALARMILARDLRTHRSNRPKRAVIVDIDETVVDNSEISYWMF